MNFGEALSRLSFVLNFNSSQSDQDFSTVRLREAYNLAYVREVNRALQQGLLKYFHKDQDFVWPTDQVTLIPPTTLNKTSIISFRDVTSDTNGPGSKIDLTWRNNNLLQWGSVGPGDDRIIRALYVARPVTLTNDADTPDLIAEEYQDLLVWSAAIELREIADEKAPDSWRMRLEGLQMDWWKSLTRGRPYEDIPTIIPNSNTSTGFIDSDVFDSDQDGSSLDSW